MLRCHGFTVLLADNALSVVMNGAQINWHFTIGTGGSIHKDKLLTACDVQQLAYDLWRALAQIWDNDPEVYPKLLAQWYAANVPTVSYPAFQENSREYMDLYTLLEILVSDNR